MAHDFRLGDKGESFMPWQRSTRLLLSCCLLAWTFSSHAQSVPTTVNRVTITQRGIISAEIAKDIPDKDTAAGVRYTVTDAKFVRDTSVIPAERGVRFGFRWEVFGSPSGANVQLRIVKRFPSLGITNPETHETTHVEERTVTVTMGVGHVTGYAFDHDFVMIPGIWTWEIWYGEQKLAEQTFTVVDAH